MGLHGKGVFGFSSANVKGNRRRKCPHCGKIFVIGSSNLHRTDEKGEIHCPNVCPKCYSKNWDWLLGCRDCGYELI